MLLGEKLKINKLLQTIFKKYDSYAGSAFFENQQLFHVNKKTQKSGVCT